MSFSYVRGSFLVCAGTQSGQEKPYLVVLSWTHLQAGFLRFPTISEGGTVGPSESEINQSAAALQSERTKQIGSDSTSELFAGTNFGDHIGDPLFLDIKALMS